MSLTIFYSEKHYSTSQIQTISLTGSKLNGNNAMQIQQKEEKEENPISFTLWGQMRDQSVSNPDLYRLVTLNLITVYGDSSFVLPSDGILDQDDYEGCLLSEDMAYELFQSKNVIDQEITYKDTSYTVRGTIPGVEQVLMIQASSVTGEELDCVSVEISGGRRASTVIQELANRHGFPGASRNMQVYSDWSKMFVAIILMIMGGGVLLPFIKNCKDSRMQPALCMINCGITLLFLIIFIWIAGSYFHYPEEMIPNRWSDLEFWTRLWRQGWAEFLALLQSEKTVVEMAAMAPFFQVLKYGLCVIVLYGVFLRRIRIDNVVTLYLYLAVAMMSSYIGVLLSKNASDIVTQNRAIWYIMLFYLCGSYLKSQLRVLEKKGNKV